MAPISPNPLVNQKRALVTHLYTADPSAHVFNGRIYIYPSHDLDEEVEENDRGDQYRMTDYHVFSQTDPEAPVFDHGEVLHLRDVPWVSQQMWAPDAAFRDGKYFLYFPARDKQDIFRIGVATAPRPEGPFVAQPLPIKGSFSIDPCVFREDDGSFYMFFGGLWGGQLQCWTENGFDKDAPPPKPGQLALLPKMARLTDDMLEFAHPPRDVSIVDETGALLKAEDIQRRYFEGPWVHKYNGLYYFSYSTGDAHTLVYATSEGLGGPYTFRGRLLDPVLGWTTHHSIIEHGGRWWLYYHDSSLSGGTSHKRCVKVQELHYNADGTIRPMTA